MTMAQIRLGKADAQQHDPTHVKGIRQGNAKGNYEQQAGFLPDGRRTAAASTGVNPKARDPIDPRMPNLPPA
jgi:hypothetical protein